MNVMGRVKPVLPLALSILIYVCLVQVSVSKSEGYRIPTPKYLMPASMSLLLGFGDSNLAANINYFRVVTVFHYTQRNLDARAVLLEEASKLNNKHADSMFQSAALPWEGPLQESIESLQRYGEGRYWDWKPVFMLGLTEANFNQDYVKAAEYVLQAAARSEGQKNYGYLNTLAANLYTRDDNLQASLNYVNGLKNSVKQKRLQFLLQKRADSLSGLIALREVAEQRQTQTDTPLTSLQQLVDEGYMETVPVDPIGVGYGVDSNGVPYYERDK